MYIPQRPQVIPQRPEVITMPANLNPNQQQQIMEHYRKLYPQKIFEFRIAQLPLASYIPYQPQNSYHMHGSRPIIITQQNSPLRYAKTQPNISDRRTPPRQPNQIIPINQNNQTPLKPQDHQPQDRQKRGFTPAKGNSRSSTPFKNSPKRNQIMQVRLKYQDGTSYEGEVRWPNIREGQGNEFDRHQNKVYEGQWKNGKKNGNGIQVNFEADLNAKRFDYTDFHNLGLRWLSYEGEFFNDIWHGQGFLQIANGEKIVGTFKNGFIDGPAVFTTSDPFELNGVWKDGIWQDV